MRPFYVIVYLVVTNLFVLGIFAGTSNIFIIRVLAKNSKRIIKSDDSVLKKLGNYFRENDEGSFGVFRLLCGSERGRALRDIIVHQANIKLEYYEYKEDSEKERLYLIYMNNNIDKNNQDDGQEEAIRKALASFSKRIRYMSDKERDELDDLIYETTRVTIDNLTADDL